MPCWSFGGFGPWRQGDEKELGAGAPAAIEIHLRSDELVGKPKSQTCKAAENHAMNRIVSPELAGELSTLTTAPCLKDGCAPRLQATASPQRSPTSTPLPRLRTLACCEQAAGRQSDVGEVADAAWQGGAELFSFMSRPSAARLRVSVWYKASCRMQQTWPNRMWCPWRLRQLRLGGTPGNSESCRSPPDPPGRPGLTLRT